jgi:hypothetical protein
VVYAFPVSLSSPNTTRINLAPIEDSGFTADRSKFCQNSFTPPPPPLPQTIHSEIFCPDTNANAGSPVITADPQAVFPNQLQSLLIVRNALLYVPTIGAQPEPPVRFNVNVQGLVNVVDINQNPPVDVQGRKVNLNAQVTVERNAGNTQVSRVCTSTPRLWTAQETSPTFLFVSRGGDFVIEAQLDPVTSRLDIGYRTMLSAIVPDTCRMA